MLISELAAKTGVSTDTIRFYEKQGLLQPDGAARGDNNYRNYTDEVIEKLNFIIRGKKLGFTLKEIKTIIAEWDSVSPEQAANFIQIKVERIEAKIEQLQEFRTYLLEKKAKLEDKIPLGDLKTTK
jgi:MerR family transcriptional regulator, copper efflux regulator